MKLGNEVVRRVRRLFRGPEVTTCPENPAKAVTIQLTQNGGKRVTLHVVRLLRDVLRERGHSVRERNLCLMLDHELVLIPRILRVSRYEGNHWNTVTTVEAQHPRFGSSGVFEFQHTAGHDVLTIMREGFEQFETLDLPVLLDSLRPEPKACSKMVFKNAGVVRDKPFHRQVMLGPPIHRVTVATVSTDDQHAFCPCCFFTHAHDVMKRKLEVPDFLAIRMFASRDRKGEIGADCRVNGVDWPEGQKALLDYIGTWPDRGWEIRKQYVTIRTVS